MATGVAGTNGSIHANRHAVKDATFALGWGARVNHPMKRATRTDGYKKTPPGKPDGVFTACRRGVC